MKQLAQFEARLTWGGLNNTARTNLAPIREGCVQIATALFAMGESPYRQTALLSVLQVWNYAITCEQTQQAPLAAGGQSI